MAIKKGELISADYSAFAGAMQRRADVVEWRVFERERKAKVQNMSKRCRTGLPSAARHACAVSVLAALLLVTGTGAANAANAANAASAVNAAGDVAAGQSAFNKCASCHQVGPSARAGFGPQLNGIIGRAAASSKDYSYSAALRNSRIVWTEDKLRAFLKGPSDLVPGTKMRFWGISDEQQISNLLAYLRTFK